MCTFTPESTYFIFNKRPIYTHAGASAKFSTNSHETDYSAVILEQSMGARNQFKYGYFATFLNDAV